MILNKGTIIRLHPIGMAYSFTIDATRSIKIEPNGSGVGRYIYHYDEPYPEYEGMEISAISWGDGDFL